ncbi:MAG TPA: TIR domain-containing protein [Vineibacter sp.]|nr:TIR domain-containing protein [Vineibacter sp.]
MSKRFRIAFSFAGEKRDFVAQVAEILARRFSEQEILYDKYHKPEFARDDLAFYLPPLYREHSDLVVAVLCKDYEKKEWTGLEWKAIYSLIKKRKSSKVMLCRFDLVEGEGLYGLAGFIDLDDETPAAAATLILQRLAINEGNPKDHYTSDAQPGPDWPEQAPPLDWPVADHTAAQRAFAQLITRAAPFRILPIHGVSETGKSHLTKQFLSNSFKIADLTRGRFDFKGSSDMDGELRAFAERLKVKEPTAGTAVSAQLASVFASLETAAHPTLLIFDTFEQAGKTERWVKDNLLLAVIGAPWLRVIIVGQRPISRQSEPWAGVCSPSIELIPPTAEEWFEYGRQNKPGLTFEFVKQAHEFSRGKGSTLHQLLSPAE